MSNSLTDEICRGGPQNLSQWSPDFSLLHFHVWGYMNCFVYECKVDIGDENFQHIFDAARRVNNIAVLRKITTKLTTKLTAAILNIYYTELHNICYKLCCKLNYMSP
jgi:hypothetical protein